jgi:hypothetical protein
VNTSPIRGSILQNLYGLKGPTTDSAFNDLLDRKINIASGIRSKASDSQNHLRDFLSAENSRDSSFPRVLSKVDSDFLGGSFARHTKNWPLDDIDIYIPLDGWNLFYMRNGQRLPYDIRSDGPISWNPLLGSRWMSGGYVSSTTLISEFARVLARHYPRETEVRPNGKCVSIRMRHGETADADGLGYDVVPCFSMKPEAANEFEFYLMPDGSGGWIRTNPKLDRDVCEILHSYHNKLYRKVVKLVKYWNEIRLGGSFSSYYIEFAICRDFWGRRTRNEATLSVSEGLASAFAALERAFASGNQESWVSEAPPIEKPTLTLSQVLTLNIAHTTSELAFLYEKSGNTTAASKEWASIFGDAFQEI